jgi:toxin ParE1/3/4
MLASFALLGAARDDIRPGLRVIGFERRVAIAYVALETRVDIIGIYYGGQTWESGYTA